MLKVQYYIWLQVFSLFKKINEASSLKSEPALYLKASRGRLNWLEFDCKKSLWDKDPTSYFIFDFSVKQMKTQGMF